MRRTEKLDRAQRVVLVVALGIAFLAVGSYVLSLGEYHIGIGWTGYAPLSAPSSGLPGWAKLLVWLALTMLWAVISIRLLRPRGPGKSANTPTDGPPAS